MLHFTQDFSFLQIPSLHPPPPFKNIFVMPALVLYYFKIVMLCGGQTFFEKRNRYQLLVFREGLIRLFDIILTPVRNYVSWGGGSPSRISTVEFLGLLDSFLV